MVKFFGGKNKKKIITFLIIVSCCLIVLGLTRKQKNKQALVISPTDANGFQAQIVDAVGEKKLKVILNNNGTEQTVKLSWDQEKLSIDEENFHVKNGRRITEIKKQQQEIELKLLGGNVYSIEFEKNNINEDYSLNAEK